MSGTLPNNALLTWLQDYANDEFTKLDTLAGMYTYFASSANDPIHSIKTDDRHYCFLIFQKGSSGSSVASILHHLSQFPARMGQVIAYDGNWYLMGDQPVAGNQIMYELPAMLFSEVPEAQCYTPDRVQGEISNDPDLQLVTVVIDKDNLEDLVSILTRRGMWIPNSYVALCLGEELGPVDIWNRLYRVMLQKGHTTVCSPLVQYLQYHLGGAVGSNEAIFDSSNLLQPRVNAEFLRHRSSILAHLGINTSATPNKYYPGN